MRGLSHCRQITLSQQRFAAERRKRRHRSSPISNSTRILNRGTAQVDRQRWVKLQSRGHRMARMPTGEPMSVPDPAGELYDQEMAKLRSRRLAEEQASSSL